MLRLCHFLRLSIQPHDDIVVAPDAIFLLPILILNLERAKKLLQITLALLQLLDSRFSSQGG